MTVQALINSLVPLLNKQIQAEGQYRPSKLPGYINFYDINNQLSQTDKDRIQKLVSLYQSTLKLKAAFKTEYHHPNQPSQPAR